MATLTSAEITIILVIVFVVLLALVGIINGIVCYKRKCYKNQKPMGMPDANGEQTIIAERVVDGRNMKQIIPKNYSNGNMDTKTLTTGPYRTVDEETATVRYDTDSRAEPVTVAFHNDISGSSHASYRSKVTVHSDSITDLTGANPESVVIIADLKGNDEVDGNHGYSPAQTSLKGYTNTTVDYEEVTGKLPPPPPASPPPPLSPATDEEISELPPPPPPDNYIYAVIRKPSKPISVQELSETSTTKQPEPSTSATSTVSRQVWRPRSVNEIEIIEKKN